MYNYQLCKLTTKNIANIYIDYIIQGASIARPSSKKFPQNGLLEQIYGMNGRPMVALQSFFKYLIPNDLDFF